MGETDRSHRNEKSNRSRYGFQTGFGTNALMTLFSLNAIFFLVLMVIRVGVLAGGHDIPYFVEHVVQWFQLPAGLLRLSERPWTVLVYMFTDTGSEVIRAVSNMIWLWAFGYLLQQMAGNDKIIPVYLYSGLLGAVFFILSFYFIPGLVPFRGTASLLGANAAVMGVAMATTTLEPGFRFFTQIRGGIPIWVLMAIYLLIDLASIANGNPAIGLSHLGGALAGFLFVLFLRRGYDGSLWMNNFYRWISTVFDPKPMQENIREKIFYNSGNRKPFIKKQNVTQKRVDEILDKINQKGYRFLTDEEKEFLKKASEDDSL